MTQQLFDPGPKTPPNPTFRVSVQLATDLRFDLRRFIQNHLDEYLAYQPDEYFYDPEEKPLNFMHDWIIDRTSELDFSTAEGEVAYLPSDAYIKFPDLGEEEVRELHLSLGLNPEGSARITP